MTSQNSSKTQAHSEQWQNIPTELKNLPQWCVAGVSKAPLYLNHTQLIHASVTEPSTWLSFDVACQVALQRKLDIGFVLTEQDAFSCIDLDVVDADRQSSKSQEIDSSKWTTPEQINRYQVIVEQFDSYTEHSRSGKGLHIWVRGKIGKGCRRDGVEVYSQERFIICTGVKMRDQKIQERSELLSSLVQALRHQTNAKPLSVLAFDSDDPKGITVEMLANIAREDNGKLGQLFRDGIKDQKYPSQSEADLALVIELLKHTSSNKVCWGAFKLSELGKRKKAERTDYMNSTITQALILIKTETEQIAHGKSIAEVLLRRFTQPILVNYFRVLNDNDLLNIPAMGWVVKKIIPNRGIGSIYGPSMSGKSFLALDLLGHIANGLTWFGQRVKKTPVIYIPFEGQAGIPNRIKAWRLSNQFQYHSSNLSFIFDGMDLNSAADRDKLIATLKAKKWSNGVLCIDTLAQSAPGVEENSSKDMGQILANLNELQTKLNCVVLVIHHTGKDVDRGMRGWSGLTAALDFAIECQFDDKHNKSKRKFMLRKVKDGENNISFNFALDKVSLGFDEDGEEITSLRIFPQFIGELNKPLSDAEKDIIDETFILSWVRKELEQGNFPSKNSLKKQVSTMKQQHEITQVQILGAIDRMFADGRLASAKNKSPNGNLYIITIEKEG